MSEERESLGPHLASANQADFFPVHLAGVEWLLSKSFLPY